MPRSTTSLVVSDSEEDGENEEDTAPQSDIPPLSDSEEDDGVEEACPGLDGVAEVAPA